MNQYNSFIVKLSISQLNQLKSTITMKLVFFLRLLSNMIGNSHDETNFPHDLFSFNRQVANLHKAFDNNSSTDIKLSKIQISRII